MPKIIKFTDIKNQPFKNWIIKVRDWLEDSWGLSDDLAERVSVLLLYASLNGISWDVVSGFRDPERQRELQLLWDRGIRTGLVTRPATNSKHSTESWLGRPAAEAVDLSSTATNLDILGSWAPFFGLKWGGNFRNPDPVHFFI